MATEERVIHHRLEELHGSGYEVVDGQPDIIGWDIKSRSGKKVGEVADLLFERGSRKVRYLVVDLDDNELGMEEDREVLIPIGLAELYTKSSHVHPNRDVDPAYDSYDPARDGDVVFLPGVSAEQLDELPLYEKNHLSPHVEIAIRKILEPGRGDREVDVERGRVRDRHRDDDRVRERYDDDEFYRDESYNDDRFYRHRVK
ncbi:MAG TPA: PRC-barrel domain-containing protein [Mucilaginibacter sp.]|nr:PRC-barrel domain-containing protein [Mucilaginibacter sp.]